MPQVQRHIATSALRYLHRQHYRLSIGCIRFELYHAKKTNSNSVSQGTHCSPHSQMCSFVSAGWSAPILPHESLNAAGMYILAQFTQYSMVRLSPTLGASTHAGGPCIPFGLAQGPPPPSETLWQGNYSLPNPPLVKSGDRWASV
jgi:hypothetical protein